MPLPHAPPPGPIPLGPIVVDQARTRAALAFPRLIGALRDAFIAGAETPLRHRHAVAGGEGTLLLMPSWQGTSAMGIKLVTVFPGNGALGLNSVFSTYLLCDGATGRHLAVIDGNEITGRRTAAASALAGAYLARPDAATLLIAGAGHVASMLAQAWSAVRPIRRVAVWNPRPARAETLAAALRAEGYDAAATEDLESATRAADIVSCATLATAPIICGAWLRPGSHLDLIGGYRPDMRETDDTAIRRARIFIDTDAALAEAGDLTQPIAAGIITRNDVTADLAALCRGTAPGRTAPEEITLFKSVGSAIEDLAAAMLVWDDVKR
jgi:ornithine cyclodeaminase/alanine dehydrogenase-like protein (mu-crystallin family)